ncbi:MAG: hypothetical protein PHF60_05390 [Candidatus ainarchaeum sp.]|nr:hypothetical protein [Candidatus ainarchaeum sp.]
MLGRFFSMLVENGKDREYTITTFGFPFALSGLTGPEGKKIRIIGDVGDGNGPEPSGTVIITGNAGECVGRKMQGGRLEIHGRAGDKLGEEMEGGEIIAEDAGADVGHLMKGGSIHINGRYGSAWPIEAKKQVHSWRLRLFGSVGLLLGSWSGTLLPIAYGVPLHFPLNTLNVASWAGLCVGLVGLAVALVHGCEPEFDKLKEQYSRTHGKIYHNGRLVFSR